MNNDNPDYGTEGGNDTKDKVFLLSIEEVLNPDYGFSSVSYEYDNARWRTNTTYAKEQGAYTYSSTNEDYVKYNGNGCWWLRSPGRGDIMGTDMNNAATVGSDGYISYMGDSVDYNNYVAVCPALHLNLSSASIWSYAGTVCTDGTVDERKPVVPDDTEPDEPVTPEPEPDKPVTPEPEPEKPVTPEPDKTETPEPDKPATKTPAKKKEQRLLFQKTT